MEYSKLLNICSYIEPLAFFLYRNQAFTDKINKGFIATYLEYDKL